MKTFQYQVLRFMPDKLGEEFINVGIVLFEPESKTLFSKMLNKAARVTAVFPEMNSRALIKMLHNLEVRIKSLGMKIQGEIEYQTYSSIQDITNEFKRNDGDGIYFSEVKQTLDISAETAFTDLFDRFIQQHLHEEELHAIYDKEVWSSVYKQYFDANDISKKLMKHEIKTPTDKISFEHSIKNGIWHCFEPVSFNLVKEESIKNKVYRWMGKLMALNSATEMVNIYLLTQMPSSAEMRYYVNNNIKSVQEKHFKVRLIYPEEADSFAIEMRKKFVKHLN